MSALIFDLQEDKIILAMDTLVSIERPALKPVRFTTKILTLPHINCVICGVGSANVKFKWYEFVMNRVVAKGIVTLDAIAQKHLNTIISEDLKDISCTIYQFGVNEYSGKMNGFAYRGENNYISQQLEYNYYIRPAIPNNLIIKDENKYKEIFNIMKAQKELEDSKTNVDKVLIGGTMQLLEMSKDNMQFINYNSFDDYEQHYEQIERYSH